MIVLHFYALRLLWKFNTISLKNFLGQALWVWSVNYFLMLIHPSDIYPPFPYMHRSADADKYYTKASTAQTDRNSHIQSQQPNTNFVLQHSPSNPRSFGLLWLFRHQTSVATRYYVCDVIWSQPFSFKWKIKIISFQLLEDKCGWKASTSLLPSPKSCPSASPSSSWINEGIDIMIFFSACSKEINWTRNRIRISCLPSSYWNCSHLPHRLSFTTWVWCWAKLHLQSEHPNVPANLERINPTVY